MLLKIMGTARGNEEEYVEWIVRVTRKAEAVAEAAGRREWVHAHARAKWQWAGHVARRPATTWVWRVTSWRDHEWQILASDGGFSRPLRPARRRWMKWEDALRCYSTEHSLTSWTTEAANRETWALHNDLFAKWFVS